MTARRPSATDPARRPRQPRAPRMYSGSRDWEPPHERESVVPPLTMAVVVGSIAFVLAGFAWPHAAGSLLRLLLASVAIGFVAVRAYRAVEPAASAFGRYSPFDPRPAAPPPPLTPEAIARYAIDLAVADDPRTAGRRPLPPVARTTIRHEAARRLATHHSMRLDQAGDHAGIRALVSDSLWRLIRPAGPDARAVARYDAVPVSALAGILDELERL